MMNDDSLLIDEDDDPLLMDDSEDSTLASGGHVDRDGPAVTSDTASLRDRLFKDDTRSQSSREYKIDVTALTTLSIGATLTAVAWILSGWLTGLFSATLPLPDSTQLVVATVAWLVLVYYVAVSASEDGVTMLDDILGRIPGTDD